MRALLRLDHRILLPFPALALISTETTHKGNVMSTPQLHLKTMSSIDLLVVINSARKDAGERLVRINDFNSRIEDELSGDHYETFVVQNSNKTKTKGFSLTYEQSLLVGMRESKAVRRKVLEKIKALEAKYTPKLPASFSEALQLAADQAKQLEEAAPKLEVYEKLAAREHDINSTTFAKQLGISAKKLNIFLKLKRIKFMGSDLPQAPYAEWFNVIPVVANGHESTQTLITPKGQIEITKRWNKHNKSEVTA